MDLAAVKRSLARPAPTGATTDFNRDGRTDALDVATVKRNLTKTLAAAPVMPAAPASNEDDSERGTGGDWAGGLLA